MSGVHGKRGFTGLLMLGESFHLVENKLLQVQMVVVSGWVYGLRQVGEEL